LEGPTSPTTGAAAVASVSDGTHAVGVTAPASGVQLPAVADSTNGSAAQVPDSVANARGVIVRWKPSAVSNGASPAAVKGVVERRRDQLSLRTADELGVLRL